MKALILLEACQSKPLYNLLSSIQLLLPYVKRVGILSSCAGQYDQREACDYWNERCWHWRQSTRQLARVVSSPSMATKSQRHISASAKRSRNLSRCPRDIISNFYCLLKHIARSTTLGGTSPMRLIVRSVFLKTYWEFELEIITEKSTYSMELDNRVIPPN